MPTGLARRSIQEKVSITLFGVMGVLGLFIFVVLRNVVAPTFDELERKQAATNLHRAANAIANDLENLSAITGDWALWDDAYDYVTGAYPAFRDSNLVRPTLTNLNLSLLAIYDLDGGLIWGQVDNDAAPDDLGVIGILEPGSRTANYLLSHADSDSQINGILNTGLGPMLISSWPVNKSDGTAPIAGTLIMGQLLGEVRMKKLRDRTEVQLGWRGTDGQDALAESFQEPLNQVGNGAMHHETRPAEIVSSGLLIDLFNNPVLFLEVSTPRQISALGQNTVSGAMVFLTLAGIIVAIVAWALLRQVIVLPLEGLAKYITRMRESGDLSARINANRADEIGSLANEFDKLTNELQEARTELLDQSFRAGKADTAAEVLHNVRNAMTPLINSLDRLGEDFSATKNLKVENAIAELGDADCPQERGGKLLQYLGSAFQFIVGRNEAMDANLDVATRQAYQVEAILLDQEKYANVSPVMENLNLSEVLVEAVLVLPTTAADELELDVVNQVNECNVRGHRVGLMQVLGNLILNAYESIQRGQSRTGRIELSAVVEADIEHPMVRLIVRDSGCGFDETFKQKIFQRGFSSKQGHMSGLGLHWCANALAGMGGRIQAESRGPGMGAEFHVLLPAAQGGLQ